MTKWWGVWIGLSGFDDRLSRCNISPISEINFWATYEASSYDQGRWCISSLVSTMAAPALKRRKISHSDMEMAPEGAQSSASSDIESQSSEEPTQHAPVERPNGTTTRPVRATPKQDEYSMYTGGLHKSHLFKLQVDTLVTQLQPNYGKRADSIDNALRVLKQSIERIEERQPVSVCSHHFE